MKEIEGNTNRWKDKLCLWIGRINIAKMNMGKTWPVLTSGPAVSPNALGTHRLTGMNPHKDTSPKLRQVTVSHNFTETERVKQNKMTKEYVLNERPRNNSP